MVFVGKNPCPHLCKIQKSLENFKQKDVQQRCPYNDDVVSCNDMVEGT
jgi:hypothetical protein